MESLGDKYERWWISSSTSGIIPHVTPSHLVADGI